MAGWSDDELDRIDAQDELQIAGRRRDGSLREPVRSVNGPDAAWYRGTRARHEGHVSAGGIEKDVAFEDVGGELEDRLDDAYRSKYRRYSEDTLRRITSPEARSTTLRLTPRP